MTTGYRMIVPVHGGPEVIEREDFEAPTPGPDEVLIETEAVGLNFIDTYYRKGLYADPLPVRLGSESVGRITAIGEGVTGLAIGDRIGCTQNGGAYATHRIVPAAKAIPVPSDIDPQIAAAVMLKGLTACYLAEDTFPAKAGDIALVHSAAGGVGSLLVPWLIDKGVTVIAHTGSPEKAASVPGEHKLSCTFSDLPEAVRELTAGRMCDVVYDGVGAASWSASLSCLRRRGMMVSFGNASGAVPPIAVLDLMKGGSLFLTRPNLADYIATPEMLATNAAKLFGRISRGVLNPRIGARFALTDAAEAHRALESRATTGSTVLLP
ncbi:quinone oxidoreductase family protein [Novosphingobium pentaromativorans]|uniref:Alcohol dehydrogenase zinc-binding domain protein n=1 Tax=Novosphingobium pentaromativorans US6-1 TaxID=1088721 RepID=G6EBH6_9SPHN|nr:quinone oxidoreductase [Novosphingobium pentaromativorans]AIT80378.1 quinone oxidoreductase [Novosphingobium pentaromativorans US6-1]EHJ61258.1 alcohol dehydrogenase zinc-binding domain protein [Novosphingobium pentaromativorans US6-1]